MRAAVRFAGKVEKLGNIRDECEDAFCTDDASGRFAVSDGATESSYSSIWAEILTSTFCECENDLDSNESARAWLATCRRKWQERTASVFAREDLPWFTRDKLRSGAFATFVGISWRNPQWKFVAQGDACIFVVRNDALADVFPVESSDDFGSSPLLVSSRDDVSNNPFRFRTTKGVRGDRIFLVSDALAHWFLDEHEAQEKPWDSLWDGISDQNEFEIFVTAERTERRLRNDDVTLLSIELRDD